MTGWPDHLPDGVFWLLVVVLPALLMMRLLWQLYGPASRPPPTRMAREEVVAIASAAIIQEWSAFDGNLHVAGWPRPTNGMIWTIREATVGLWWIVHIDDATGNVRDVRRQGLR